MERSTECGQAAEVVSKDDEPPLPQSGQTRPVADDPVAGSISPVLSALSLSPEWTEWQWQLRNRIRSLSRLAECFPDLTLSDDSLAAFDRFPQAITPYYASLARSADLSDPVLRMSVPQGQELWSPSFLTDDPLAEDHHMPVPGLVHRYPDRALFLVTSACAVYCRHCTRKRVTGARESRFSTSRLKQTVEYLLAHPEVRDVVVSGGDPLTMSDTAIEAIISALRSVPSVEVIRIGTRTPVTLPFRITGALVERLRRYHPIWVNTHFNHPCEITPESREACRRLVDAGFPVGNQSVLLKGINDDPAIMEELLRGLIRMRVRPYYLFQCDLVAGVEHFRTPLSCGIKIMEHLRGRLSGMAIPTFVVDLPGGCGKVPVLPEYVVARGPAHTVFRNSSGVRANYPEPVCGEHEPAGSGIGSTPGHDAAAGKTPVAATRSSKPGRRKRCRSC